MTPELIGPIRLTITKDEENTKEATASQQAKIGNKTITVTINLVGTKIDVEVAQLVMRSTLDKIAKLVTEFNLGEQDVIGQTTNALKIIPLTPGTYDDVDLERTYSEAETDPKEPLKQTFKGQIDKIIEHFKYFQTRKSDLKTPPPIQDNVQPPQSQPVSSSAPLQESAQKASVAASNQLPPPSSAPVVQPKAELPPFLKASSLTEPTLRAQNAKSVKYLECQFKDGDNVAATEKADRVDTIPLLIAQLETEIRYYIKEIKTAPENEKDAFRAKLKQLRADVSILIELQNKNPTNKATWMSTNSTRLVPAALKLDPNREKALKSDKLIEKESIALFKEKYPDLADLTDSQIKENENFFKIHQVNVQEHYNARVAYAKVVASMKDNFPSALINQHMQTVLDADNNIVASNCRSGAVSDFGHQEISLQELIDLNDLESLAVLNQSKNINDKIRLRQLVKLYGLNHWFYTYDNNKLKDLLVLLKGKALKSYGGEALLDNNTPHYAKFETASLVQNNLFVRRLNKLSTKKNRSGKSLEKLHQVLDDVHFNKSKLQAIIDRRQEKLQNLVLQDLFAQFKKRPSSEHEIVHARTALLNLTKAATLSNDCLLHERTQGLDSKAVYDRMDGKQIIFDINDSDPEIPVGPFIDAEGNIHMPESCKAADGPSQTTLRTFFFNTSVQGDTQNKGIQEQINNEALKKLEEWHFDKHGAKSIKSEFSKNVKKMREVIASENRAGSSLRNHFETPVHVIEFFSKLGAYTSFNCYGGKDRTGYTQCILTANQLKKIAEQRKIQDREEVIKEWNKKLLDKKEGIGPNIAKNNADHTVFKLPGANLGELFTFGSRIKAYKEAAGLALKGTTFSQVEGQFGDMRNSNTSKLRRERYEKMSAKALRPG